MKRSEWGIYQFNLMEILWTYFKFGSEIYWPEEYHKGVYDIH